MKNNRLHTYLLNLIFFALLLTLVLNMGEVLFLIKGYFNPRFQKSAIITPPAIKIFKDLCMLQIFLISSVLLLKEKKFITTIVPLSPFFIILIIYSIASLKINLLYVICGWRWVYPFFLPFFLIHFINQAVLRKVGNILQVIFGFSFIFQLIQSLSKYDFYGTNIYGFPSRLPGIFFIPSTLAACNCICFCFFFFYIKKTFIRKILCFIAIPLSTFFTASGTGIGALALILLSAVLFSGKTINCKTFFYFKIFKVLLPLFSIGILYLLPVITSRSEIVSISANTRVRFFIDLVKSSAFFTNKFGMYTNSLASLNAYYKTQHPFVVIDSTWGEILGNLGFFGLIMASIFLIVWVFLMFFSNDIEFFCFSIIAFCFSLTTSVTESYPLYLLLAIYIGYFLRKNDVYSLLKTFCVITNKCLMHLRVHRTNRRISDESVSSARSQIHSFYQEIKSIF